MPPLDDPAHIAALVPGEWVAHASNVPRWIAGEDPALSMSFELVRTDPLMLRHRLRTRLAEGRERDTGGVDRWVGTRFRSRSTALSRTLWGNWSILGAVDDSVMVVEVSKAFRGGETTFVFGREGSELEAVRAAVAADAAQLGLTPERFATLHW